MYPDFLGIGAQKAGTTWLYKNLLAHPQIWLPPIKELHYFDRRLEGGHCLLERIFGTNRYQRRWRRELKWRCFGDLLYGNWKNLRWNYTYFFEQIDDRWYQNLFKYKTRDIAGEITPGYAVLDIDSIRYIHFVMPKAKIIFLLRNPIERAWAHVRMVAKKFGKPHIQDKEQIKAHFWEKGSRLRGDYLTTLCNWQAYYPREQIFVGFFDEIADSPEKLLNRIYQFLEVQTLENFSPYIRQKVNAGMQADLPHELAGYLAKMYYDEICELRAHFGGYTENWYNQAQNLLNSQ